jgi:GNAT superfamily N-acetyltransferase
MEIEYSSSRQPTPEEVAELYRRAELRRPVDDLDRIGRMLQNANLTITAWYGNRLIGIARSLSDFSFATYLSDLAVDPDYQRSGIGRELVRLTREAAGEESMLLLLAAPSADSYYPHIGFQHETRAWAMRRGA